MKMPIVVVSASLTIAIMLVAGFLIATQARDRDPSAIQQMRCADGRVTTTCGK